MGYNLLDFFDGLTDTRRGQGQRHKLRDVLTIVIMAIISGQQGLQGFARFATNNVAELTEALKLKHGVPCFYTIRSVLLNLEEQQLSQRFTEWVKAYQLELGIPTDEFIGLDGKAVTSTTNGGNTHLQSFISVVSAFGHQSGLVYGMKSFDNGKSGECEALRELVKQLGLSGTVFTMDALHCKKKLST